MAMTIEQISKLKIEFNSLENIHNYMKGKNKYFESHTSIIDRMIEIKNILESIR
jgi:hypothetical protein